MYVSLGLYMYPMGLVCSLGAHLCPLGVNYVSWGSFMLPADQVSAPPYACASFLCVRALASFRPLEAHICSLGAHICPLGLIYGPRGQVRTPPVRARPSLYICAPWLLLSPLRLIYVL
jgi:hypothetical protein